MKDIKKIVIKGTSGYCSAEYAFQDKLTITADSISYEYNPYLVTMEHNQRKWSYKTNSQQFFNCFEHAVQLTAEELAKDPECYITDVGGVEFIITYDDNSRFRKTYYVAYDYFEDYFKFLKTLIPPTEEVPEVLKTSEDFEEE